jgi:hypothetical protein
MEANHAHVQARSLARVVLAGLTLAGLAAIAVPGADRAQAAAPGNCGEYMHWRDGKCVDARNRGADAWPQQMHKKYTW